MHQTNWVSIYHPPLNNRILKVPVGVAHTNSLEINLISTDSLVKKQPVSTEQYCFCSCIYSLNY